MNYVKTKFCWSPVLITVAVLTIIGFAAFVAGNVVRDTNVRIEFPAK